MVRYTRLMGENDQILNRSIDTDRQRFPHCVVWTPLPLLSWFFPLIGHTGIATVDGVIYDFAGPYTVTVDNMAFGHPTKYWQLDPANVGAMEWDAAVLAASQEYRNRMHNLCFDNCHSHVALSLNMMQYNGKTNWNMVRIALYLLPFSKFTGVGGFLKTYLPFFTILGVVLFCGIYFK